MLELLPYLLGFLVVLLGTPLAKKYLLHSGIYGIDQNKLHKPKIPTSGGIVVLFGFIISVTSFIALDNLFSISNIQVSLVLAALNTATIIALIGLIDDIHIDLEKVLNEQVEEEVTVDIEVGNVHIVEKIFRSFTEDTEADQMHRKGLSKLPKMFLVLPAVLPLMAVGAGSWSMTLPVIGTVDWGLLYPLFLMPLGLMFVSNVTNMLAGVNGLSTSLTMITAAGLGFFGILKGQPEASLISFSLAVSLLGFIYYNFSPATVLPGDSLTYLSGAVIFSAMVIGNMEKLGIIIFTLWFIEFFLKLRSGFGAASWGDPQPDGTIKPKYDKNYSLTHPLMRRGMTERQIVLFLSLVQTLIVTTAIILLV